MKSQSTKGYFRIFQIAALILFMYLIISIGTYSAFAASDEQKSEFFVENCNLTEEYSRLLSQEIGSYSTHDTDPLKTASQNVLGVINSYRKQLIDLQSLPEAKTRSLSREAKLIYTKGLGAAKLTWIYYYNLTSLSASSSVLEVRTSYESYLSELEAASDSAVLSASCELYAARLNNKIYEKMISELSQKGDSIAASSIIAGGIEKLALIESPDILGAEQAKIYTQTISELHLQRSKDLLYARLEEVFKLIRPGETFLENSTVALFNYRLSNAKSIQEMNIAMQSALDKLLETPQAQKYRYLFTSTLRESIALSVSKATENNSPAEILALFDGYTLGYAKAHAKDQICTELFSGASLDQSELQSLEERFNSMGGIIDSCLSFADIEIEKIRAHYLKLCYASLSDTDSEIKIVLEPHDPPRFLAQSQSAYSSAKESIFKLSGSSSFESACTSELSSLQAKLKIILGESKAERFLLDNKQIIAKPNEALTEGDELALRSALCDYTKLEKEVSIALTSQINSIAEKYNIVLSQIIRAKADKDALYLDICEVFCEEIKNLPRNNIADYYNKCDLILKKASTLLTTVSTYREIVAGELYQSYNAGEREALIKICRDNADRLAALNLDDSSQFDEDAESLGSNARVALYRKNETVRIRVASQSSANTEIKAIVADANAKINASFNRSEMISIADKSIFKINRLLTADAIDLLAEKQKTSIDAMRFLSNDKKSAFKAQISTLQSDNRNSSLLAENLTVLQFVWDTFRENLDLISQSSESENLTHSLASHLEQFKKECDRLSSELRSMIYLTSRESADFSNKITELNTSFNSQAISMQKSSEVEALYSQTLATLNSIRNLAIESNLDNRKSDLTEKLSVYRDSQARYSAENYNKILDILSSFTNDLASAATVEACDLLYKNALSSVESVSDLLSDAKASAIDRLESHVESCKKLSTIYSSNSIASMEAILKKAKQQITSYTSLSDVKAIASDLEKYMGELTAINKDYLSSSPDGLSFLAEGAAYPLQYDFINGYWGLIYLPDSLPGEGELLIVPLSGSNNDSIARIIRRSVQDKSIKIYGASSSSSYLKDIKKSVVSLAIDVSLTTDFDFTSPFTLQMLLPDVYRDQNVLGVAFVGEDGSVEFYSAEQRDALISLTLTHLSEYYILTERTANISWLIVLICAIISIELFVFASLLLIRYRRKRKENNMFPLITSCFISPLSAASLTKIRPEGAVSTTLMLAVGALALGCAIALLARAELSALKSKGSSKSNSGKESENTKACLLRGQIKKELLRPRVYELDAHQSESEDSESENIYCPVQEELKEKATVLCGGGINEQDMIAGDGISDDTEDITQIEQNDYTESQKERPQYKSEINLDVIAQKFSSGDLVTLDLLKRKRLVSKKTDYVKILARGALSKPLIVEADDFSHTAEEMLRAVGGEAIRTKNCK